MILLDTDCENCKHFKGLVNEWNCGCDAFPEGFTKEFLLRTKGKSMKDLRECANGIKYEPKDDERIGRRCETHQ